LNEGIRGLILGAVLALIGGVFQLPSILGIVIFLLTFIGSAGLGFALAGMALVNKRVGGVTNLLWQMLVFFTGALAPLSFTPALGAISKFLPLSWGISGLRAVFLKGATFSVLRQNGLFLGLLANTAAYVLLGAVFFYYGNRKAKEAGSLAHY
jgi:ABC-2 type transport system permease protein